MIPDIGLPFMYGLIDGLIILKDFVEKGFKLQKKDSQSIRSIESFNKADGEALNNIQRKSKSLNYNTLLGQLIGGQLIGFFFSIFY